MTIRISSQGHRIKPCQTKKDNPYRYKQKTPNRQDWKRKSSQHIIVKVTNRQNKREHIESSKRKNIRCI